MKDLLVELSSFLCGLEGKFFTISLNLYFSTYQFL